MEPKIDLDEILSDMGDTITLSSSSGTLTVSSSNTVVGGGVASGSGLTYTTGTGVGWQSPATGTTGTIHAKDVNLEGRSLKDTLEALEQRLNILVPNPDLEKEWDQLKQLGDQYRKLEQELTEKTAMWKALKAEDR